MFNKVQDYKYGQSSDQPNNAFTFTLAYAYIWKAFPTNLNFYIVHTNFNC